MTIIIFILSYLTSFILSMIYISPYYFILYLISSYIIGFLIVILFYLLNFPIVLILKPTHKYKHYLMKSLSKFLNRCYLNLDIKITGLENIPKDMLIVAYANHKSYTDAFALLEYFPRPLTLTPKKAVLKIPFLRLWLKAYDVFAINRNNARETLKDIEQAVKTVQNGHVILFFPEGTIKNRENQTVEGAKAGSFQLVKRAQAGILPILYEGNDLVRKRWPRKTKRNITIFPVITYDQYKHMNTKEISQLYMDTINRK